MRRLTGRLPALFLVMGLAGCTEKDTNPRLADPSKADPRLQPAGAGAPPDKQIMEQGQQVQPKPNMPAK